MSGFVFIQNGDEIASHGMKGLRKAALEVIDHGIQGGDPGRGTHEAVHREGDQLHVGALQFDLAAIGRIYVLGTGKGSYPIAKALEDISAVLSAEHQLS